jgi:eukaryotic-like serine/threonine-protein kinase
MTTYSYVDRFPELARSLRPAPKSMYAFRSRWSSRIPASLAGHDEHSASWPDRPDAQTIKRHMRLERLGRYELLEELSREADGVVYKASDPLLDRLVAIKTIELGVPGVSSDLELSFERTAKLAACLTHPNIVVVHDMGRSGDVAYIATELLDGQTLRAILDSGVALAPSTIERIAAQVANGLEFAHQHAIVHCDVNPSTIVVLDIGIVKITHRGNALFLAGSRKLAGSTRTSPHYMSPEQAMGAPVDARSDIFSLGVVLYEMLAGVAPFTGSTADDVVDELMHKKPVPPSSLNRNIPSGFDYIVARALAKDPDHRYQSARDMASDLRKWALEEPMFFPTPLAYVGTAQTTTSRPAGETVPRESAASGEALNGASSQQPRDRSGHLQTRRQWLFYGIPSVLLALTGGWTLLSRRAPPRESNSDILLSAIPDTLKSASLEFAPIQDVALPSIAQSAAEQAGPSPLEPARAAAGTRPVARLGFAVSPWGEIYVDGRRRGVSPPLREIELPPGKYTIEIKNTIFPTRRQSVDVRAKARIRIKHKFQ